MESTNEITSKLTAFAKKNVVMLVAFTAAVITCFFVPVDREYLGYFDVKTLTCLFCVLAVVCALKNINFFYLHADLLVGVNIGGVGTLISSLASLITFREYGKHNPGRVGYYIGVFSLFNFGFLFVLTGFMLLLKML